MSVMLNKYQRDVSFRQRAQAQHEATKRWRSIGKRKLVQQSCAHIDEFEKRNPHLALVTDHDTLTDAPR